MSHPFQHPLATHPAGAVLGHRRNGSPIYAIAGGSGEGENGSDPTPSAPGSADPAPTPPTPALPAPPTPGSSEGGEGPDWKTEARKWEARAKENKTAADELEKLKAAQMSEQEKTVAAAEKQGRTAALAEAAPQIAQARLEAAAARAGVDLAPLAEFIDVTKFLGEDGTVDDTAIKKAVEKLGKLTSKGPGRSGGDMGGAGGSGDQAASLEKQIEEATKRRDFATVIRLKRQKAATST